MGQKRKTEREKEKEKKEEERLNDGDNNGQAMHGTRMAHSSRLGQQTYIVLIVIVISKLTL